MAKFTVDIPVGPIHNQEDAEKSVLLFVKHILVHRMENGKLLFRAL